MTSTTAESMKHLATSVISAVRIIIHRRFSEMSINRAGNDSSSVYTKIYSLYRFSALSSGLSRTMRVGTGTFPHRAGSVPGTFPDNAGKYKGANVELPRGVFGTGKVQTGSVLKNPQSVKTPTPNTDNTSPPPIGKQERGSNGGLLQIHQTQETVQSTKMIDCTLIQANAGSESARGRSDELCMCDADGVVAVYC